MGAASLSVLLGPIKYASAKGWANLPSVKGLTSLLTSAVARAKSEGLAESQLQALEAEIPHVDSNDATERKASLTRVMNTLKQMGFSFGTETVASEGTPMVPLPAIRKEASAPSEEISKMPTKLLSIAPRHGPLAAPLKDLGQRLNPRLLGLLKRKGIHRAGDVLFLLPRLYEDRRHLRKIAQLRAGERATFLAEVRDANEQYARGRKMFRAILGDGTGTVTVTHFQSGVWLKARYPVGKRLIVSGEVRNWQGGWEVSHPEVEPAIDVESSAVHFNRIVPVYPGVERFEQRSLRDLSFKLCERLAISIEDPLPDAVREQFGLLTLSEAIRRLHFPGAEENLEALNAHRSAAHQRLAFDELFFLQLGMALRRAGVKVQNGISFDVSDARVGKALELLPFQVTGAQKRVIEQVSHDMKRPEPMNRLVQGDVGSGKTAVAQIAAAVAVQSGYQVAVMAPTEILAEQHHRNFSRILAPLGVKVGLLTASGTAQKKRTEREAVRDGHFHVAVGTHALLQDSVEFARLGLVVIDEQHRFGVIQRHALMNKGVRPDVLVMTATPIPRTLAMTLYGDLDVSVIDELPPGRTPIVTRAFVEKARETVYEQVRVQLEKGHQVYVVYPLVEESEKVDLADATQGAARMQQAFPQARVGLLHGRMKNAEKDEVMQAFREHKIHILVCTTVVEVGVDVPNASAMIIEAAERFGLSQLHQLRGRVGRGAAQSFCYLLTGYAKSEVAKERLSVMEESNDGFVIAERDLKLRGPGEFLGTRQSGMPELAVADLSRDQKLLALAQEQARRIVESDPRLERPEHAPLVQALEERWEGRLKLARVG